jgi:uncharacterized membrane protein YhaH (DUF805 family)
MASNRIKRQIERLLDNLEEAVEQRDWQLVRQLAEDVLVLDPDNVDAPPYLSAAERVLGENEEDSEDPDNSSTSVNNLDSTPQYLPREEFVEPPPIIAEAFSETFAQARARVAREEGERAESNSDSEVPARTVTPIQAVVRAFTHCVDWSGRSSRSEFWWFFAFYLIFTELIPGVILSILAAEEIYLGWFNLSNRIFRLAIATPLFFLIVRRLRDTDKAVWWSLLAVPYLVAHVSLGGPYLGYPYFPYVLSAFNYLFIFCCLAYCAMPSDWGRFRLVDYTMSRGLRFKRPCLMAVFKEMLNALRSPSTVQRFYLEVIKMVGKVGLCILIGGWLSGRLYLSLDPLIVAMAPTPSSEWINEASKRFATEIIFAANFYLPLIPVILVLTFIEGRSFRELIKPIR